MAEAEDVIVDAAAHVADRAYGWWLKHRPAPSAAPGLVQLAPRIDRMLLALTGRSWALRVAQPPAPLALARRWLQRHERPWPRLALPAAAVGVVWLPASLPEVPPSHVWRLYRAMAVHQTWRVRLHEAGKAPAGATPDVQRVLLAEAAEAWARRALPGLAADFGLLRETALALRPPLELFPPQRRAVEQWVRERLRGCMGPLPGAQALAAPLWPDWWTGGDPPLDAAAGSLDAGADAVDDLQPTRSARLPRRPQVREARPDEDDAQPGAWMIQTAQPHEHAEDPMGLQRPSDRDADSAAEAHAESVADLPEARLVRSRQRSHEVLLADDLPAATGLPAGTAPGAASGEGVRYPEWDFRIEGYAPHGTLVWQAAAPAGDAAWVEATMREQQALLQAVRRRFELLRAQRQRLLRQEEGDELDLQACVDAVADRRAGGPMAQRLYAQWRRQRRDTAVLVLVDASGSTDSWIDGRRRVVDVEREALLPLATALDATGDANAILAFSGCGAQRVTVQTIKRFDERFGSDVALRIAGLEPQRYTRAGAALRHAAALLARQPARHRLVLMLTDGKPNDEDLYEGRYGVEDLRRAVAEARAGGLSVFCLTVDRHAAGYLPRVFGAHHWVLLRDPARLPHALTGWMHRLLAGSA